MILRDYQEKAFDSTFEAWQTSDRTLAVMPTGTGKTVYFGHVIDRVLKDNPGKRAMVIAHREELLDQAMDKIGKISGRSIEVEQADRRANESSMWDRAEVIVSSVQTQNANMFNGDRRMARFDPREFCLLVIDEAHHAVAQTYLRLIDHYAQSPNLKVLGVTATPDRRDEKALGRVFESVAVNYEMVDAISDGWLVPVKQLFVQCEHLDFSKCRTTAGDLNGADLARVVEEEYAIHEVVTPLVEIMGDRRTLLFAATVNQAERMMEVINRHKPDAARLVTGKTPKLDRRELLDGYYNGEFQVLCNVGVATEGFDVPGVEVVAIARPTKSRALYAQMIGRGTRPLESLAYLLNDYDKPRRVEMITGSDKPNVLVIDFVGNSGKHKLINSVDILGGKYTDEVLARAAKIIEKEGDGQDVKEAIEKAVEDIKKARERRRREPVKAESKKWSATEVSPFDLFKMAPLRQYGWEIDNPPTEKQANFLAKQGIDVTDLSKGACSQLIGECIRRRERGLCTYKQAKTLDKFGEDPNTRFEDVNAAFDRIKARGWRKKKKLVTVDYGDPFDDG
jgi:superfamily II DNA or RNA helicase